MSTRVAVLAQFAVLAFLACIPLAAGQTAQPKPHKVTLKWNSPAASSVPAAVGYNIYRSEHKDGPYEVIAKRVQSPTYTDTKVRSGHIYYYKVTSVAANGKESTAATTTAKVP